MLEILLIVLLLVVLLGYTPSFRGTAPVSVLNIIVLVVVVLLLVRLL